MTATVRELGGEPYVADDALMILLSTAGCQPRFARQDALGAL